MKSTRGAGEMVLFVNRLRHKQEDRAHITKNQMQLWLFIAEMLGNREGIWICLSEAKEVIEISELQGL